MSNSLAAKATKSTTQKKDSSSKFSQFFREASSSERKKVFLHVAREASKEQLAVVNSVKKTQ